MPSRTETLASPLMPTRPRQRSDAEQLDLPRGRHNLFARIIRNPYPRDRPPRERECAEMLCGVLDNAPELRTVVMHWLAERARTGPLPDIDHHIVRIDTEQAIGTKRDDLRITARDPDSSELALRCRCPAWRPPVHLDLRDMDRDGAAPRAERRAGQPLARGSTSGSSPRWLHSGPPLAGDHDRGWEAIAPEQRSWNDLCLRAPLEPLLGAANQVEAFEAFFLRGFEDLLESGVAAAVMDACDP
ncbi:MAG: hypothetical protein AB1Z98_36910 [Nannocystaceae bacterium]